MIWGAASSTNRNCCGLLTKDKSCKEINRTRSRLRVRVETSTPNAHNKHCMESSSKLHQRVEASAVKNPPEKQSNHLDTNLKTIPFLVLLLTLEKFWPLIFCFTRNVKKQNKDKYFFFLSTLSKYVFDNFNKLKQIKKVPNSLQP